MKPRLPKLVVVKPVEAWSPSVLRGYEDCPAKFKYEKMWRLCTYCFTGSVLGKPPKCNKCGAMQKKAVPLVRGDEIHAAAEKYIRGLQKDLSPDLRLPKIKKRVQELRAGYKARKVRTELELAFTQAWKLTGWFDQDVYVRFKIDIMQILTPKKTKVTDWKTGRPKEEEYDEQLRSYAIGALSAGFGEETQSELVFTDHNLIVDRPAGNLKLVNLGKEQKALDKRAKKLFVDRDFLPRPQDSCRYCPFSRNKGGPCEY